LRSACAIIAATTLLVSLFSLRSYSQVSVLSKNDKEKDATCRVSGMVVKLADGAPLRNATVQLENGEDREHTIATKTATDGRFELKNIPAGRYKLYVWRNGFVETEYGKKKPSDPGAAFSLSPGEIKKDLVFRLIPAAVITGRVFDEDGEAVPNATVTASRETYHEGRRTLATAAYASTDDLGSFRLFGLAPGRYYVSASERQWGQVVGDREFSVGAGQSAEQGYAKTYYPGTPDVSRAAAINVKEGDEIPGTDIALKQVAVHRVRGRVLNQVTHKPGQDVMVMLVSRTKRLEWDQGGRQEVKKADGSFEISNVVPGAYTLLALWFDQTEGKNHTAAQKLDIGESDVEGILLTIGAGAMVPGRVVWEGKPSLERDELWINASPTEAMFMWGGQARVDLNQQFTLQDLVEGDVRVQLFGTSKDCYLKQIAYGQTFVRDDVISVSKGPNPVLEITISSRGARVQGKVTDKDGLPAAGIWVVAVPDEARRMNFRLFKSQTTDQYGQFDLHGLAPGSYKFFAWDGIESNAWEDEEFLKPFESQGKEIAVRDMDTATLSLTLIETKSAGNTDQ
jgi:protocatechuate 3,4-dioxygenase beta subunit/5-hydroxyisourate hydrolase-like protein (transthyretin family)